MLVLGEALEGPDLFHFRKLRLAGDKTVDIHEHELVLVVEEVVPT
jgi:hypothetical protein